MRALAVGIAAIGLGLLAAPGAPGAGQAEGAASRLFAAAGEPAPGPARALGGHARGCLAGGVGLARRGPGWRLARPERDRHWGHPAAIAFIERFAAQAREAGWPGIAVGDLAQPRGGPMPTGHRSHQTGLDIDIWFRPLGPEGGVQGARSVVARDGRALNGHWRDGHGALLALVARDPGVDRIFVNPAIKARLCERLPAAERGWLRRIRPWWGHDAHFHIRLACPEGAPGCEMQDPLPEGDGCDATLAWWFTGEARSPAPPAEPRGPLTLAELPPVCAGLVTR